MKPSALKREHPALQNMKFFSTFVVIFALLDPNPDFEYGSGSTDPIKYGSKPDLDPQPWPRPLSKIQKMGEKGKGVANTL